MAYLIVAGLIMILLVAGPVFSQERTACDDKLSAAQKEVLVLKASREQTEQTMAAIWARLERSEAELKKATTKPDDKPEPKKE